MGKNIYTYENWLSGKICPNHNPIIIKDDNEINHKNIPQWSKFSKSVLKKIRTKQQEIFNQEVKTISQKFINTFEKRYNKSKEKNRLKTKDLRKMEEILFDLIPSEFEFTIPKQSDIPFKSKDLIDLQKYIEKYYIIGEKHVFDFIHSPNCEFQDKKNIQPEILGEAYYILFNHIRTKSNIDYSYKYNGIFEVEYGLKLCATLVNKIVKEKSKISDYSFIYNKLVAENIIDKSTVPHKLFIKYINDTFPIKLESNLIQLRNNSTSRDKERYYLEIKQNLQKAV